MTRDAFISHATKDQGIANFILAALEDKQISCWIAPRDIPLGGNWADAIIEGLDDCRLLVLVLTPSSNESPHVLAEVQRARDKRLPIITFRPSNVKPSPGLEFFVSTQQYVDAFPDPLENYLPSLCEAAHRLLALRSDASRQRVKVLHTDLKKVDGAVLVGTFQGHADEIRCLSLAPNGNLLLSGGTDGSAHLWDAESGRELRRFVGHSGPVRCVAFSPDGRLATSGGGEPYPHASPLHLWDVETGQKILSMRGHRGTVCKATFSRDGSRLLSAGWDGSVRLWNVEKGEEVWAFQGAWSTVTDVVFTPAEASVLAGTRDGMILLWDTASGIPSNTQPRMNDVTVLTVDPRGENVLSGGRHGTIRFWNRKDIKKEDSRTDSNNEQEDEDRLKYLLGDAHRSNGSGSRHYWVVDGHVGPVRGVLFTTDGERLLTLGRDGALHLWNRNGSRLRSWQLHAGRVSAALIAADARHALTATSDRTIHVWEIPDSAHTY